MMSLAFKFTLLAMVLTQVAGAVNGIRILKEGPKTGPHSRTYKSGPNFGNAPERQATSPVQVQCTEDTMVVTIRADLNRNGRLLDASQLRLGRRSSVANCGAERLNDAEFVIEASLHECGSELWVEGDNLIYANTLFYTPTPNPFGIIRTAGTAVRVQCQYKRTHFVSSNNQAVPVPTLRPHLPTKASSHFAFQLMDEDWKSERPSSEYQLGDIINIQASVAGSDKPVKLYLDNCVATLEPDLGSEPQYPLIQNHGCPADPSSVPYSVFLPRTVDHVLQMQVDVLPFCRDNHNSAKYIYITCFLKVSDAALGEDSVNKACTFSGNGLISVDGHHEVCECCESSCDLNQRHKLNKWTDDTLTSDNLRSAAVTVGPIIIAD